MAVGAGVSVKIDGLAKLQARLKAKRAKLPPEILRALMEAGLLVQGEARRSVQKSPRGGTIYKKYKPKRTHKASAPGEAPATDTGMLVNAITVQIDPGVPAAIVKVAAAVAPYSLPLEFGTQDGKIRARPFMRPALKEKGPAATAKIKEAIQRALQER